MRDRLRKCLACGQESFLDLTARTRVGWKARLFANHKHKFISRTTSSNSVRFDTKEFLFGEGSLWVFSPVSRRILCCLSRATNQKESGQK